MFLIKKGENRLTKIALAANLVNLSIWPAQRKLRSKFFTDKQIDRQQFFNTVYGSMQIFFFQLNLLLPYLPHLQDWRRVLCIFISVWVLRTPNVGQNIIFQHFSCKMMKNKPKIIIFLAHYQKLFQTKMLL